MEEIGINVSQQRLKEYLLEGIGLTSLAWETGSNIHGSSRGKGDTALFPATGRLVSGLAWLTCSVCRID